MRKLEMVPALFMIAASLAVILGTGELAVWDGFTPGARFFPLFVGGLGLLLAAVLLWQQWRGTDTGLVDRPGTSALARVFLTVAGLIGLAAGAPSAFLPHGSGVQKGPALGKKRRPSMITLRSASSR